MDKTDLELLEMAAKAMGIEVWTDADGNLYTDTAPGIEVRWNPLTDDGDALRLAVKLRIDIRGAMSIGTWRYAVYNGDSFGEAGVDPCAAQRRAIVRAAAHIGGAK